MSVMPPPPPSYGTPHQAYPPTTTTGYNQVGLEAPYPPTPTPTSPPQGGQQHGGGSILPKPLQDALPAPARLALSQSSFLGAVSPFSPPQKSPNPQSPQNFPQQGNVIMPPTGQVGTPPNGLPPMPL